MKRGGRRFNSASAHTHQSSILINRLDPYPVYCRKSAAEGPEHGKGAKYAYLLEDRDVRRWYQNVSRGSRITGDVYLRRIGNFRNGTGLSPKDLIELSDKQLSDRQFDYVSEKEDTNSPTYLAGTIRAVKSWLNFMGKPLRRHIKVRMAGSARLTVENEKIPTQEALKKIVLVASVRDRMCVRPRKLIIFDLAPPSIQSSWVPSGIFGIVNSPTASSALALEIKFFVSYRHTEIQ